MGAACQGNDVERDVAVVFTPVPGSYAAVPSSDKEADRDALSTASTQSGSAQPSPGIPTSSTTSELDLPRVAMASPAPAATATSQSVDNGLHTLAWDDGASYVGELAKGSLISRGVMHGSGTWTSGDGATSYTGTWLDDRYDGEGELTSEAWTYHGEFREGAFDGRGTMHWLDHRHYEGEWSRGKRHGYGLNVSRMGQQRSGYWAQNRFVSLEEPRRGCCC